MKVLVCGGRDYWNYAKIKQVLDEQHAKTPISCVIHGDARGADRLGARWAMTNRVTAEAYPANWDMFGKAAGHIRNKHMLIYGKPSLVIAFPGGRGTANMIQQARYANIPVIEVEDP
jgi:hypothetical protein